MVGFDASRMPLPRPIGRRRLLTGAIGLLVGVAGCGGEPAPSTGPPEFRGTPVAPLRVEGGANRWSGRTLRVSAFGGEVERALRSLVWDPFAAHTGCRIDSFPVSLAPVATPGASEAAAALAISANAADLILTDPIAAVAAADRGDLQPMPTDVLPAGLTGGIDPSVAAPAFSYALVNARGRRAFADSGPASWPEWWDTIGFPAARALGRSPIGTLEVALLGDGVPAADLYPMDVERALVALERIAPTVGDRWWSRGIEPVGWLGDDRAELATAWHHRVVAGQWDGLAVEWSWEAALLVTDQWVIPAGAREPEIAADLVRFALSAQVQAAFAREIRLGPVNPAAVEWIEPWLLPTIPTAPPHAARLVALDPVWWAGEGAGATRAFDEWFADTVG